jgi:hypothetical protein
MKKGNATVGKIVTKSREKLTFEESVWVCDNLSNIQPKWVLNR